MVARGAGLRDPTDGTRRVHAVLFDLDGTLYLQRPLRVRMALELAAFSIRHPLQASKTLRLLSEFRRAQEVLRGTAEPDAAVKQLQMAADRSAIRSGPAHAIVSEWMMERPLKHLVKCRARGVDRILGLLARRNIPAGVLSDYPSDAKLEALGIRSKFSVVLSASDPHIGVFKPHPRGFLAAATRWSLEPADVLVVGDRVDADAAGALAAGMRCVIIGNTSSIPAGAVALPSLERLCDVLDDNDDYS